MAKPGTAPRRKPRFKERNAASTARPTPKLEVSTGPPAPPPVQNEEVRPARRSLQLPRITVEGALYGAILVVAFAVRFWDDGSRAMHGDESVHAWIAWNLYRGAGYQYDPVYHGPFQFPLTALFYFLFGVSNLTGRLLSILFGTALVAMPYFLRSYMGRASALLASLLIAVSPAFVYVSRLERDDSFTVFFTLTMAIAILGYLRTRRARYVYIGLASAALSLSAMENTYISVFILGSFLLIAWFSEWLSDSRAAAGLARLWARTGSIDLVSWPVVGGVIALFLLLLVLTLQTGSFPPIPVFAALAIILLAHRTTFLAAQDDAVEGRPFLDSVRSVSRQQWLNGLTLVIAILFLLFSTFGTNLRGVWDASQPFFNQHAACAYNSFPLNPCRRDIIGGLFYWLSQHNVHRGGQPWYYYTLLYSLYEQLVFVFAIGGIIWAFRRPTLFTTLLTYWAILAFGIYSWAGEKFSWLMIHPLLPMTLLAAMFIVNVLRSGAVPRTLAQIALALLGLLELHSMYEVNFVNAADPVEMMVYVQSAPDTPRVAANILAISNKLTNGPDMTLTIDSQETWPFAWYLRDMPNVAYPSGSQLTTGTYLSNPVVLVDEGDNATVASKLAHTYTGRVYKLRWWFPEDYKTWNWKEFGRRLVSSKYWSTYWQWLIDRRPFGPKASVNFYYYVKNGLVTPL
jgi:uncharacterized protein (TIGR03663 family)